MSSKTLREVVLRIAENGPRFHASAPPGAISSIFNLTSRRSSLTRAGSNASQTRLFHHTPARRLFESSDAVVAACVGATGGLVMYKYLPKYFPDILRLLRIFYGTRIFYRTRTLTHRLPPWSWAMNSDAKTRGEVQSIVTAGFEMAREKPIRRRDQALREASFQVPYETARLNPHATQFELENMGPMLPVPKKLWKMISDMPNPPFDVVRDACAYLYFPNGSNKATAAFLAINAEIVTPKRPGKIYHPSKLQVEMHKLAPMAWMFLFRNWVRLNPNALDRIGSRHLPVIFSFREVISACMYDTKDAIFKNPITSANMFSLANLRGL